VKEERSFFSVVREKYSSGGRQEHDLAFMEHNESDVADVQQLQNVVGER
jgi:hypothetical protein